MANHPRRSKVTDANRWTPRRRGPVYCSPGCGFNCTHAAFEKATRDAAALCKRLGAGWTPRVWENLGWHYSAKKGVAEMHASFRHGGAQYYMLFFNSAPQIVSESYTTPEAAVEEVKGRVRKLAADFKQMEGALA